ncbi:hypothetical protein [Bradyrhizobium sp. Leo121]|uniref:hypothetical protein n=1 Tax=Bradyrhizobium sp. Leo121 TaxID=1571195 RepID=UPI00102A9B8E|nr:hypothetical protein [Bradyrhizobium sp. Leo121]RZN30511.1 hypothetical protein CWO90_20455 [Bradyrhizobium sp. Leo121]
MDVPLRTNFHSPKSFDREAIKRYGFHDQGIVVVSIHDPRLTWDQREILKAIGEKLFGNLSEHKHRTARARGGNIHFFT